jgi:hypothetical protein
LRCVGDEKGLPDGLVERLLPEIETPGALLDGRQQAA